MAGLSGPSWEKDLDKGKGLWGFWGGTCLSQDLRLFQGEARHAPVSEHGSPEPPASPV